MKSLICTEVTDYELGDGEKRKRAVNRNDGARAALALGKSVTRRGTSCHVINALHSGQHAGYPHRVTVPIASPTSPGLALRLTLYSCCRRILRRETMQYLYERMYR
jgi:hypothetical protein